jgi:hypothetical protein
MVKLAGVEPAAANRGVDRDGLASQVARQFIGPLLAELFRAPGAGLESGQVQAVRGRDWEREQDDGDDDWSQGQRGQPVVRELQHFNRPFG